MTTFASRFVPRPELHAEWLAHLWYGPVPDSLVLHKWLYLGSQPPSMLLLWEGDEEAAAWVEAAFVPFGEVDTQVVADATGGLVACLERDLEGFGQWLRDERGASDDEVAAQVDLRRGGLVAADPDAARAAGRQWAAGRSST